MGGWVGGWVEEEEGFRMRCCGSCMGGWVGGWVGGWSVSLALEGGGGRNGSSPHMRADRQGERGGWVGGRTYPMKSGAAAVVEGGNGTGGIGD